jgi:DedD protein
MADQDTEITLGMGRLLGLFFGLVVLCALAFAAGYSLGKSSASSSTVTPDSALTSTPSTVIKPTSAKGDVQPDCNSNPDAAGCQPAASSDTGENTSATGQNAPEASAAPAASSSATPASSPAPELAKSGGYIVQVAAISKQQDAEALADALKKKNYNVLIATPSSDSLFHVQIGPFADLKDAESIRARLVSDGYNPILKR